MIRFYTLDARSEFAAKNSFERAHASVAEPEMLQLNVSNGSIFQLKRCGLRRRFHGMLRVGLRRG